MTNHIKKQFQSYEKEVMPADAGRTQRIETRRAFWAGARAMWAIAINDMAALPDDEAEAFCQDIEDEFEQWVKDLKNGRA